MVVTSKRLSVGAQACNGIFLTFKHLEKPIGVRQHIGLAIVDVIWLVDCRVEPRPSCGQKWSIFWTLGKSDSRFSLV